MKQISKSIISVIFLITIFLISFLVNYEKDFTLYCNGELNCINNLVQETSNPALCEKAINKSTCYTKSANYFQLYELCEKTTNISSCYFTNAKLNKNPNLCQKTNDLEDNCLFEVAIVSNNSKICDFSENSGLCYYSYALHTNQSTLCDFSEKYKKVCYDKLLGGENEYENN